MSFLSTHIYSNEVLSNAKIKNLVNSESESDIDSNGNIDDIVYVPNKWWPLVKFFNVMILSALTIGIHAVFLNEWDKQNKNITTHFSSQLPFIAFDEWNARTPNIWHGAHIHCTMQKDSAPPVSVALSLYTIANKLFKILFN